MMMLMVLMVTLAMVMLTVTTNTRMKTTVMMMVVMMMVMMMLLMMMMVMVMMMMMTMMMMMMMTMAVTTMKSPQVMGGGTHAISRYVYHGLCYNFILTLAWFIEIHNANKYPYYHTLVLYVRFCIQMYSYCGFPFVKKTTGRVCCHYHCLPLLAAVERKNSSRGEYWYLKDVVNMASQCIQHPMVQLVSEGALYAIARPQFIAASFYIWEPSWKSIYPNL